MKIGISINEVLRDFIGQMVYTYDKYIEPIEIKEGDVTSFNLIEYFKFDDMKKFNTFVYMEACMEIFAHADQVTPGMMTHINNFIMEMADEEEHQIQIVSREIDKTIPSTLFFLSKLGCKATDLKFVKDYADKWKDVDILITANPEALAAKPAGKTSVKVKASYNTSVPADFEIDSILDFIKDTELREKILNTKITTYEDIK